MDRHRDAVLVADEIPESEPTDYPCNRLLHGFTWDCLRLAKNQDADSPINWGNAGPVISTRATTRATERAKRGYFGAFQCILKNKSGHKKTL